MSETQHGQVRIGISGWRYDEWRSDFYPEGLVQRNELAFASRMLTSIEINGSFYSLQRPESYQAWHDEAPDDFVFAIKGPKFITHERRLKDVRGPLANFLASGLFALRGKLGPILWQFPPMLPFIAERFEAFFAMLPHDTDAALELARHHDRWLDERKYLETPVPQRLRHAVEVRHKGFADPAFIEMLRKHDIALVVADTAGRWPLMEDVTADFVYLRLHGDKELYASGYSDPALDDWARRIEAWRAGGEVGDARLVSSSRATPRAARDVYCYFDNDIKVHAPYDAARLAQKLGVANGLGADRHFITPPELMPKARGTAKKKAAG